MITRAGPREGARLRPRQAGRSGAGRDELGIPHLQLPRRHAPRRPPRHARVHVPRAGRGPPGGRALRRLRLRRRPLRDAHREAALRRRERALAPVVHPARHAPAGAPPAPRRGPADREPGRTVPGEGPRRPPGLGAGAGAGARGLPRAGAGPLPGPAPQAPGRRGRPRPRASGRDSPPASGLFATGSRNGGRAARRCRRSGGSSTGTTGCPPSAWRGGRARASPATRSSRGRGRTSPSPAAIRTEPAGAEVFAKPYAEPDGEWERLGVSPLEGVGLPFVPHRLRVVKSGYAPLEAAFLPQTLPVLSLVPEKDARPGMVFVPAGRSTHADAPPVDLPAYWLDRHELTNREFETFVARGRLPPAGALEAPVRRRRESRPVRGGDGALPRPDRAARALDVGAGQLPGRSGGVPRLGRELARGGGLGRVRRQEPPDAAPLVPGRRPRALLRSPALQQLRRQGPRRGRKAPQPQRLRHLRHGRQRARVGVERVRRPPLHARRGLERPDVPLHGPGRARPDGPQLHPRHSVRRLRAAAARGGLRAPGPRPRRLLEGDPRRRRRLRRVPRVLRLRPPRPRREGRGEGRRSRALAGREGELRRGVRRRARPRPPLPPAEREAPLPDRRLLPALLRDPAPVERGARLVGVRLPREKRPGRPLPGLPGHLRAPPFRRPGGPTRCGSS